LLVYCQFVKLGLNEIRCLVNRWQIEGRAVEKQFVDFFGLSRKDRIRCAFETQKGKVARILVVQYETLLHGKWTPVVRYDTAHGFFHRDVYIVGEKTHLKEFVFRPTLEEALTYAIHDIRQNWQKYKFVFLEMEDDKEKI
jgi:hypothetical protein